MAETGIEYGQVAWNVTSGCTKVSEACTNCWAERMSKRLAGRCGYDKDEPFKVTLHPDRLQDPLKWKKPRTVLVSFMGDLFHEEVIYAYIQEVFHAMWANKHHTFLLLTKRPERVLKYISFAKRFNDWAVLPNIWLGVTAENQARADERIPVLLQIPAAKRFVSIEPMLSKVDLQNLKYDGDILDALAGEYLSTDGSEAYVPWNKLDWVICGSESGPRKRPAQTEWIRDLKDQCVATAVPFYLKQMEVDGKLVKLPKLDGQEWQQMPEKST